MIARLACIVSFDSSSMGGSAIGCTMLDCCSVWDGPNQEPSSGPDTLSTRTMLESHGFTRKNWQSSDPALLQ